MNNISLLIFSCLLLVAINESNAQCYAEMWSDEFDSTDLDISKWSYLTGDGCPDICGWGNNELQYYTDRPVNISVAGGKLTISAQAESYMGSAYTSARIRSLNKGDWTGGRMEARIKVPAGQGLWPAFWMLPSENKYGTWPLSGEIDIMEILGQEPDKTYGTIHYGLPYPNNVFSGDELVLGSGDFSSDFHLFAIEWEENEIRWYVDSTLYMSRNPADLGGFPWRFDRDFHILLNLAVGGNWPGPPDLSTSFPANFEIDYVRVFQDLDKLFISGPEVVLADSKSIEFKINAIPYATYNWTVPPGAAIISGQGTRQVTVDWGNAIGQIQVMVDNGSCNKLISKTVEVLSLNCTSVIEDADSVRLLYYTSSDGPFIAENANSNPDTVNNSPLCAYYNRNPGIQYDALRLSVDVISDASLFELGDLVFEMDVYTDALPGTEILLQLENQNTNGGAFPAGRHSVYQAFTSVSNQWESLQFTYNNSPDPFTGDHDINQFVLLFDPDSYNNHNYYFDNVRIRKTVCDTATCDVSSPPSGLTSIVLPGIVQLQWAPTDGSVGCQIQGGPSGISPASVTIPGIEVSAFSINSTFLFPGVTYYWKVRCACNIDPLELSSFSAESSFIAPAVKEVGKNLNSVLLHPNPAQSQLTVQYQSTEKTTTEIIIHSQNGQLAGQYLISSKEGLNIAVLDIHHLTLGNYIMELKNAGRTQFEKFIVVR